MHGNRAPRRKATSPPAVAWLAAAWTALSPVLAVCSEEAPPSSVVTTRKAGARLPDATPMALLSSIYAYYDGADGESLRYAAEDAGRVFEPAVARALLKRNEDAIRRDDFASGLTTDPFVASQEAEIRDVSIEILRSDQTSAEARARFLNGGQPTEVLYELVRLEDGWRIHEMRWRDASLRRLLGVR
jgi:hypothetical protein